MVFIHIHIHIFNKNSKVKQLHKILLNKFHIKYWMEEELDITLLIRCYIQV
jgi:hypothetical protein